MMKYSPYLNYALSSLLLLSCTQMKTQMKKKPSTTMNELMETVDVKDEEVASRRTGEDNHELAEADADDSVIKMEVGGNEIDEELPGSEPDEIPYSRDFLIKKKTKRMQFWVDYFTKHQRERFQRFINNGEEYRHHIEKVFMEEGLPKELYFVGLIESGYYLGARSHAAAVGPWQFMPGTGKQYGLRRTAEYDERQDLFKSTHAAARYFKNLHNVFSSWELALSAYNAGEYGIIRRIMKHGTRDFYLLSKNKQLPSETINYVPKVLAAMHVVNNAQKYGFTIPKKKHRLFDKTVLRPVRKNTSLAQLARQWNVSLELLKKLNPELRRASTPRHFAGTYYLRAPQDKYALAARDEEKRLVVPTTPEIMLTRPEPRKEMVRRTAEVQTPTPAPLPKMMKKPKVHVVGRGETLISIARKYDTTPRALAHANDFRSWKTKLRRGQKLRLSEDSISTKMASTRKIKPSGRPIVYKVRAGDNLNDLARIFNLNVAKLKKANRLKRGSIMVGQRIVLPDTQRGVYVVKRGDHLTKVARELNQPIDAIIKLNSLKRKTIYPGQKIIVNMD